MCGTRYSSGTELMQVARAVAKSVVLFVSKCEAQVEIRVYLWSSESAQVETTHEALHLSRSGAVPWGSSLCC